jgi:hypothetical protein
MPLLSGCTAVNALSAYDIKTGNFNEWLVQRPKMGIVTIAFASGDTYIGSSQIIVTSAIQKAMNINTILAVNIFGLRQGVPNTYGGAQADYNSGTGAIHMYSLTAWSGAATTMSACAEFASGVSLSGLNVIMQVFGT